MSFKQLQVLTMDDESVANQQLIVPSLCKSCLLANCRNLAAQVCDDLGNQRSENLTSFHRCSTAARSE